jgi:hypothetical protein
VRLLLGAIRSLPAADQDAVLALLLHGLTDNGAWETAITQSDLRRRAELALRGTVGMRVGGRFEAERKFLPAADTKIVPVRFPAKLHEELKSWCEQHRFPMAAVVRGLVERFLESQGLP